MRLTNARSLFLFLACLPFVTSALWAVDGPTVEQTPTGIILHNGSETLRLTACSATVIHVVAGPGDAKAASPQTPWINKPCEPGRFDFAMTEKEATFNTAQVHVSISMEKGVLTFKDPAGKALLRESGRQTRRYIAAEVNGEKLYHVSNRFEPDPLEGFYGLGQHQSGVFNYRGSVVELAQANTDVAVPMFVSTNGYGVLLNTASKSWFDNRFPSELNITTEAADAIDYYFIYGPEIDQVIHEYRNMTGHAPLFGKWAYGFVQSKDRYKSAKQLLDIAAEYRSQHVPLDLIVQDWFWWKHQGDPVYTDEYLKPEPDVPAALKKLHDEHMHAIISVWAVFDPQSDTYKQMKEKNFIMPGTTDYDATNPAARDLYWNLLIGKMFAQGWDGFWLDSSEPEGPNGYSDATLDDTQLSIGNGARYTNIFPLMHTGGVYEHWRKSTEEKRVFILTRSAFTGQQRNASVTWSGDVTGTFTTFKRQIPAGLNFELSGIPYWTTDIAGYGWPLERDTRDPKYQELYTRWFQFGTFCPIFRTHGHRSNDTNEIFAYGPQTPTLISYDKLRYRLLPYIYSQAWQITSEDSTMMRPLIMDWRTNPKVRDIGDQYMFGPSILVSPVTEEGATTRPVYLPPAAAWYDFWTGERLDGDKKIEAPAPLDRIPLYVKAGSIIPMGPEVENTEEESDPLEIRIYPGADGHFTLYADEGDNYDYENGSYITVPLTWNDTAKTLTLGGVQGSYPGIPNGVSLRVVLVGSNHGVGGAVTEKAEEEARYIGQSMTVQLK
jgi:alpha-D-xyloside xylohydrolase